MPRRNAKGSTRAKPVLPDGNDGDKLSKQQKEEKLNAYLHDLDSKVVEKKLKLEKLMQSVVSHIEACYSHEIKLLPNTIRQMRLVDFIALGGTVNAVLTNPDLCEADDDFDSAQLQHISTIKKACSRSRLNSTRMYDTISEEGINENSIMRPATKKSTVKKKPRKGKNSSILANISNTMPPPCAPPSAYRNGYFTPVNKGLSASGWDTPLITPKFDPRLPVTPALMRDAKPGEMFMSLGGSPIRDTMTTMQRVLKDKEKELLEQFNKSEKIKVQEVLNTLSDIIGKSKDIGE